MGSVCKSRAGHVQNTGDFVAATSDAEFFWKNPYHDRWLPLPQKLQHILREAPGETFRFGIDLNLHGMDTYILDPNKLLIWRESAFEEFYLNLKRKEPSGFEVASDERPDSFPFSEDVRVRAIIRPSELMPFPEMNDLGGVPEREFDYVFLRYEDREFIPYHPRIQHVLNTSHEPCIFGVFERENWPELFGGGYNEHIVDPQNLIQISQRWESVRSVATLDTKSNIQVKLIVKVDSKSGKYELGRIPAQLSWDSLPKHYIKSKRAGIYLQQELKDTQNLIPDFPKIDIIYYVLYACYMEKDDVEKYLNDNVSEFQKKNEAHGITGALLIQRPDDPKLIMQYFEGSVACVLQLKQNIKSDPVVRNFETIGEGFIEKRLFKSWNMKRKAESVETKMILEQYIMNCRTCLS